MFGVVEVSLLVQRVHQHVEPQSGSIFAVVPATLDRLMIFQRAANVIGRENHGPAMTDLDSLQLRSRFAYSGRNRLTLHHGEWIPQRYFAHVVPAVSRGKNGVLRWNRLQGVIRQRFLQLPTKGGCKRFACANRVGQQSPSVFQIPC